MTGFASIVVAFDGSDPARHALNLALEMAQRFHSEVTLLAVVPLATAYPETVVATPAADLETARHTYREMLESQKTRLEKSGVSTVRLVVLEGSPAGEILRYLEARPPELLVMGARNLSGVGRLFLGSVSDAVVHHAPCPVLIARAPAAS